MTQTVARINYALGVCSSMYCDAIDKNKFEASGFRAFDSNLAIFYIITLPSPPSKIRHSLLHKNAMCSKSNHNKHEQ